MSPATVGIIGIGLLIVLFLLRMPVGFAMGFVGVVGFGYLADPGPALSILAQDIFEQVPEGAFPERNSYGEILNPGPEASPPAPAMPEQAPDAGLMAQGNMRQPPAGTPYYEDPNEMAKIYPGGQ